METDTMRTVKGTKHRLLPFTFLSSISLVSIAAPAFFITHGSINNGGGLAASPSYATHYSLGQFTGGHFTSTNYQIQTQTLSFPDIDGDGIVNNSDNCQFLSNRDQLNTDNDSLGDACDTDDDNDGLSDDQELSLGTHPLMADTDGDGLDDGIDPNPLIPNGDGDLAPYGNPDGIINIADLLIARQIVLGQITPSAQDIIHADIYPVGSPDGVIDISDLILLEQQVLSLDP